MKENMSLNSFETKAVFKTPFGKYAYFSLNALAKNGRPDVSNLPITIKILIEQALRTENGREILTEDVERLLHYNPASPEAADFPFSPARVLMQDFTGVPAVVDLAALRHAVHALGKDPEIINPRLPVDLVIDHSVQVDAYASDDALDINARLEFERNRERYEFLHWGQKAFSNFRVVPPASGICHQVNLEYLGQVVQSASYGGDIVAFPDTLVGTDSHTTMINGLGILGWGVGGIEAEAAMLGQPIFMLMPQVIGFKLTGRLPTAVTATDLVLVITQILRNHGVVGKFVEFFGDGLDTLTLPDRATVSNMAPEYGATCGFFPADDETLRYLRNSNRSEKQVALVERYCKVQGLFRTGDSTPVFTETVELDLSTIEPSLAGPKRPQDRISIGDMKKSWSFHLTAPVEKRGFATPENETGQHVLVQYPDGGTETLSHGDVVIAAITSCTNTSNPWVMIGAGVLAKKAVAAGLRIRRTVKTSLAPGSNVVTSYLSGSGLMAFLEKLGFHLVGFGCTTCIGNSGPLPEPVVKAIEQSNLAVCSVLSGNRNFEGRITPYTKANYLASPPLVIAYALAGTMNIDLTTDPIGTGKDGNPVYLKDIWPTDEEIREQIDLAETPQSFEKAYKTILTDNETWNQIPSGDSPVFNWNESSTYIQLPPFFEKLSESASPIESIGNARALVMVGQSVTTDHISPAGVIAKDSPAGRYLIEKGVSPDNFNSYGSRRGNDRVMTRGTFANIRLRNLLAPGTEGGGTTHFPSGKQMSIYDASVEYKKSGTSTVVLAGKDYGMGSSRDWAAKGTFLLGVKAVIAESFERIHRSNLVGMGVLPLQFEPGQSAQTLGLTGTETFTIELNDSIKPFQKLTVKAASEDGSSQSFTVSSRLDTTVEISYYRNGGILHTVLRNMIRNI